MSRIDISAVSWKGVACFCGLRSKPAGASLKLPQAKDLVRTLDERLKPARMNSSACHPSIVYGVGVRSFESDTSSQEHLAGRGVATWPLVKTFQLGIAYSGLTPLYPPLNNPSGDRHLRKVHHSFKALPLGEFEGDTSDQVSESTCLTSRRCCSFPTPRDDLSPSLTIMSYRYFGSGGLLPLSNRREISHEVRGTASRKSGRPVHRAATPFLKSYLVSSITGRMLSHQDSTLRSAGLTSERSYGMKVITAEWLRQKNACKYQVRKFKRLFPNGAKVTLKNLQLAALNRLDIEWFSEKYLSWASRKKVFNETQADYDECEGRDDMRNPNYRRFQLRCIRPIWNAIKLDRE